jgi:hypothetical protein
MPTATPLIRAAFSFVGEFAGMFRRRQSGKKNSRAFDEEYLVANWTNDIRFAFIASRERAGARY